MYAVVDILLIPWRKEAGGVLSQNKDHITELTEAVLASGFVADGDSDNMWRTGTNQWARRYRPKHTDGWLRDSNLRLSSPKQQQKTAFSSNL